MKKSIFRLSGAMLSLTLVLGGCGGGSQTMATAFSNQAAAETMAAAYDYDNGTMDYERGYGISMDAMPAPAPLPAGAPVYPEAAEEKFMETEMQAGASTGGAQALPENSAANTSETLPLERKLIRNMNLSVETTSFDTLLQSIQTKVGELQGYIEQSDISGNSITNQGRPSKKYANLVLRIPAQNLNSFISQVESEGNVTYKSESINDVTLEYSDVESRLKTLRMEQERLWELLAQADSTESIILLEERLTEVSSEIESSESRLRHMDNSVTYSTVYLDITEVDIESPTQPETAWQQIQRGFTRNLISLMDNLTIFFIHLLSSLPVLIFLALLVLIVVVIIRRIRKKHKKPPVPPVPQYFSTPQATASASPNPQADCMPQVPANPLQTSAAPQQETAVNPTQEAAANPTQEMPSSPQQENK